MATQENVSEEEEKQDAKPSTILENIVGWLGLAFCLLGRDTPQFLGFDAIAGVALSQYGLALGRLILLAIVILLLALALKRSLRIQVSALAFVVVATGAALLQMGGLLLVLANDPTFTFLGCLLVGLGQSALVITWALWLLRHTPYEFLALLIAGFLTAGALEVLLSLLQNHATIALSLGAPLASAVCAAITSRRRWPAYRSYQRSSRFKLDGRFALNLALFFIYSFIARQLTDAWMAQSTADSLATFEFCGGLGTAATAAWAWATRRMYRDQRRSGLYLFLAFPLVIAAAYLSTSLEGVHSTLYVIPLFTIRKTLLLFTLMAAIHYFSGRDRLLCFAISMACVEIGNLAQTAIGRIVEMAPIPTDVWTSIIFCIVLVLMFVIPLLIVWPGRASAPSPDVASDEERQRQAHAQALAELAAHHNLTGREREVLEVLDTGRNAEYIARTLYIAHSTAKSHIAHIYQKTGLNSQQLLMDVVEQRATAILREEKK